MLVRPYRCMEGKWAIQSCLCLALPEYGQAGDTLGHKTHKGAVILKPQKGMSIGNNTSQPTGHIQQAGAGKAHIVAGIGKGHIVSGAGKGYIVSGAV